MIDPKLSFLLGPTSISQFVWGNFATLTYTNQYEVFLLPRMSGLSREAGFFVSLLLVIWLLRLREQNIKKVEWIIFILAFSFSLSKVSIAIILLLFLLAFRRIIKLMPLGITYIFSCFLFIFLASYLDIGSTGYLYENTSLAHRFSSAYLVYNMNAEQLVLGCHEVISCSIENSRSLTNYLMVDKDYSVSIGILGLVVDFGILGIILFLFTCYTLKIHSFEFLVIIVFTSTVYMFSIDSFVIFAYYYAITNPNFKNMI
ncbi:hypothetical protein [Orbus mooreae]|uniref:hypothetical protein n=1 Tax=Orbus mooreae TaxID=3074107 RepID=UPI00370DBD07